MPYYKRYKPVNGSCYKKADKDFVDKDPKYLSPDGRPRCVFLSFTNVSLHFKNINRLCFVLSTGLQLTFTGFP